MNAWLLFLFFWKVLFSVSVIYLFPHRERHHEVFSGMKTLTGEHPSPNHIQTCCSFSTFREKHSTRRSAMLPFTPVLNFPGGINQHPLIVIDMNVTLVSSFLWFVRQNIRFSSHRRGSVAKYLEVVLRPKRAGKYNMMLPPPCLAVYTVFLDFEPWPRLLQTCDWKVSFPLRL